jgi:hypothetical protein
MMGKISPEKQWANVANVGKTATSLILRTTNGLQSHIMWGLPYSTGGGLREIKSPNVYPF